jgi:hypothetical protein
MVVNKSSATNNTTPAAKEKYAASTMILATVRLFVMAITSHRGADDTTLASQRPSASVEADNHRYGRAGGCAWQEARERLTLQD